MEFLNVFAAVDTDHDLVIHEADLDNYAASMKYEKAFTNKWLRLFDSNKDGKFTFSEFCETLGLDEKIYEDKLREARKTVAQRQQQQQQKPADSDRANSKPVEQDEVKENIEPQQARKVRTEPPKPKEEPEEVEDEVIQLISVEFSDMEPKDLDEVKRLLAQVGSKWRRSGNDKNASEFERQMMHELDRKLDKSWQCQVNPELSYKDVNYQEGSMAVLVTPQQNKRVMVWRPQPTGGMCCCC
uniref:EF-hand domain-containing protein n=1 Tax=Macrostomum lignano TaxID=282301 RepID=A0A1I8HE27_9PLAT